MKNFLEINRALAAKKTYIQPQVQVTPIKSVSVLCVSGGSGGGAGAPSIHSGIPTDEQW